MTETMFPTDETPDGEVLRFEDPTVGQEPVKPTPFTIGDDPTILYALRPKKQYLLNFAVIVGALDEKDATPETLARGMAMLGDFLDRILLPESRDYLTARFDDPEDPWDIDVLTPTVQGLVGLWFARPTGSRAGSSGTRRNASKRSTARLRSQGASTR